MYNSVESHQSDCTWGYLRILLSAVIRVAPAVRAVAIIILSAGSEWRGSGKVTDLEAIRLSTGMKRSRLMPSTLPIHESTSMFSCSLPLFTNRYISQILMEETRISFFSVVCWILRFARSVSLFGWPIHHTKTCVSRTIMWALLPLLLRSASWERLTFLAERIRRVYAGKTSFKSEFFQYPSLFRLLDALVVCMRARFPEAIWGHLPVYVNMLLL